MATPSAIPINPSAENNEQIFDRVTKENRHLWYRLRVLQQPERARACGSGMKANSDRRPVDPPPVVELCMFEGPSIEEGKDITFDYNANFFLYASLEHARPLAHGRVQTPAATNPPILTGVPASGMAYLDRPVEAGYFIFPDLSVRHEGRYRLSFSLFETTKEEKDFDLTPAEGILPPGVDWRMEIKTQPFNVFSAKKFPGLMESTSLSKTVAEQGCRVRIRRDVRMRKRDNKGSSGYERREEDFTRHRTVTPAPTESHDSIRARSLSSSSEQRVPYGPELQRRPSVVDNYARPPPPPPPSYDPNQATAGGHLSFGDAAAYAAPHPPARPQHIPPTAPAPGSYVSAQPVYAKQDMSAFGYAPPRPLPPTCPSPGPNIKQDAHERRPSGNYVPPSPSGFSSSDGHVRRDSHVSYPATPVSAHTPNRSYNPLSISALSNPAPIEADPLERPAPRPIMPTGGKRKHDHVFTQNSAPLYNGQRQLDPHLGGRRYALIADPDGGTYARAGGEISYTVFNQFTYG